MLRFRNDITLMPTLQVVTIPEDDQLRQTGVMILGVGPVGTPANELYAKLWESPSRKLLKPYERGRDAVWACVWTATHKEGG